MIFSFFRKLKTAEAASDLATAADLARDGGDWAAAARLYHASLKADPAPAHLWIQYGHALKESARPGEAEKAYRAALVRKPDDADGHLQMGHLHKLQGRLKLAAHDYAAAVRLDPTLADALAELRMLLDRGVSLDDRTAAAVLESFREDLFRPTAPIEDNGRPCLVFDVSDLIGYFQNARLPTGIQRVQIELITALLASPRTDYHVLVAAFTEARDTWAAIHPDDFMDICRLAKTGGVLTSPDWVRARDRVQTLLEMTPPLAFPQGAWLVNLGTSWWLRNYFLRLREAKARYGIRYAPFVHDMIPVMAPEHCTQGLTQDFISWALGVFRHADAYLTNSESSRRDLVDVAARLGQALDETRIGVIRLDADFRNPAPSTPKAATLESYGLAEGGFVLFVSTIEARKNHLAAFRAWSGLIRKHGADRIPALVCVGNRGWLNEAVMARLEADLPLRKKVRMLSGVPDPDLANLYAAARFALYPSQYEGWGLPITEALCHGKAVLTSDSSSLPEAGGEFAFFFRDGDQRALTEAVERLIFDGDAIQTAEQRIRERFRPRSWSMLADEVAGRLLSWMDVGSRAVDAPVVTPGRFYRLRRSVERSIPPLSHDGEACRAGDGWSTPEDWGCRTRSEGGLLQFSAEALSETPVCMFLGLRGLEGRTLNWTASDQGRVLGQGRIVGDAVIWATVRLPARSSTQGAFTVHLTTTFDGVPPGAGPIEGAGVVGFMICAESDVASRTAFAEALRGQTLDTLAATTDADF